MEGQKYSTTFQVVTELIEKLKEGRIEEAAELYGGCQEDVGFVLMARAPQERPFQVKLARMFFAAKDFEKAAMVLESNGEHKKAAELYERTDSYEHAAEMWEQVGDLNRAALNYERNQAWEMAAQRYTEAKNFVKAAFCFEKAVNHFLAGKYYLQIGKHQKSIEMLERVSRDEADYLEATLLIGEILSRHGYLEMAETKYRNVIRSAALGPDTLPVYFELARILEKKGASAEALEYYQRILEIDPDHEQAAAQARALAADNVAEAAPGATPIIADSVQAVSEEVLVRHDGPQSGGKAARNNIVSMMDGFEFLKKTALFEDLSLAEMKRLWTICQDREFAPGEIIIEQFQPGRALYIVRRGQVAVQKVEADRVKELVRLGPGSYVGEMSLISQSSASARVVAGPEGVAVFAIVRDNFEELLASDDKAAIKIYKVFIDTLCERLRKTTEDLAALKAGVRG